MMLKGDAHQLSKGFTNHLLAGSTSEYTGCGSGCRWGEYSSTEVAPSDATVGWGFNQVITGPSEAIWSTRAGEIN